MSACDWLHLETIGSCFDAINYCIFLISVATTCIPSTTPPPISSIFSYEALPIEQVLKLFPLTFMSLVRYLLRTFFLYILA